MEEDGNRLFGVKDAAALLGVTQTVVAYHLKRGHLKARRVGSVLAIPEAEIARFMAERAKVSRRRYPDHPELTEAERGRRQQKAKASREWYARQKAKRMAAGKTTSGHQEEE